MSIKDSITDAFKEENTKLQSRLEQLEEKLLRMEIAKNNYEQYTWCNNIETQGIPVTVTDDRLKNIVIDIFRCLKINTDPSDIEDYNRLGTSTPNLSITNFVKKHHSRQNLICER